MNMMFDRNGMVWSSLTAKVRKTRVLTLYLRCGPALVRWPIREPLIVRIHRITGSYDAPDRHAYTRRCADVPGQGCPGLGLLDSRGATHMDALPVAYDTRNVTNEGPTKEGCLVTSSGRNIIGLPHLTLKWTMANTANCIDTNASCLP